MQDLDAIMAGRDASASAPTTEQATERADTAQRERDEQGRFAAKQEQQAPETPPAQTETPTPPEAAQTPPTEAKPNGMIPQQALHAEKQKAKALERELAEIKQLLQRQQPQTKQEPAPDPLAAFVSDPTAFFQQQVTPVQQQMSEMREMVQELHAAQAHGLDKVAAAKQAAEALRDAEDPGLPALIGRLRQAANPFDELVRWHSEQTRLSKYGDDPEAYINAEVERRMAAASQQQQPAAPGSPNIPPSFAAARNGAPRESQNYGGPRPLSEIMKR